MTKPSLVLVLAEDERHQRFVRHYLYRRDLTRHDIRMEPLPSGRGCGEQWVRERYATAVQAYRARAARAKTALIVVIDADSGDVENRVRQLRAALEQNSLDDRAQNETIVHLIPKRTIETWILSLTGSEVDENTDYSRAPEIDNVLPNAAAALFDVSRPNLPQPALPSLSVALTEIERLEGI